MTGRESMQVSLILLFIAVGFGVHFVFNDGVQTESSTPPAQPSGAISKKLERARSLQQAAVRLNGRRFVAVKERKAQRARVTKARARASRALAAARNTSRRASSTPVSTRSAPSVPSAPARSTPAPAPARPSPSPKPASKGGGGGGGQFDDSG
jgi:hypothetical protein